MHLPLSINLKIEYYINTEFEEIKLNYQNLELLENPMVIEYEVSKSYRDYVILTFERRFSHTKNFILWKKKQMTGMKVSWHYSEEFIPTSKGNRLMNSLVKYTTKYYNDKRKIDVLWNFIKEEKAVQHLKYLIKGRSVTYSTSVIESFVKEDVGQNLLTSEDIPDEALQIASQMFVYWEAQGNLFNKVWDEVR